jgi:hypothetical protein
VGDPSSLAKSGVAISSIGCMVPQSFAVSGNLKDRGGNRRGGGVNGSLMKFFHKKLAYVPRSKPQTKPLKESNENTNQ